MSFDTSITCVTITLYSSTKCVELSIWRGLEMARIEVNEVRDRLGVLDDGSGDKAVAKSEGSEAE